MSCGIGRSRGWDPALLGKSICRGYSPKKQKKKKQSSGHIPCEIASSCLKSFVVRLLSLLKTTVLVLSTERRHHRKGPQLGFIFWSPGHIGMFPGQGSDPSHSCGNTGSLTYCAKAGSSLCTSAPKMPMPLRHSGNTPSSGFITKGVGGGIGRLYAAAK